MLKVQQNESGGNTHMRSFIQRIFLKKRTPEQTEQLYRQMILKRETKKREAKWQSIATQSPRI